MHIYLCSYFCARWLVATRIVWPAKPGTSTVHCRKCQPSHGGLSWWWLSVNLGGHQEDALGDTKKTGNRQSIIKPRWDESLAEGGDRGLVVCFRDWWVMNDLEPNSSKVHNGKLFGVQQRGWSEARGLVMLPSAGHLRVVGGLLSEHKLLTFVDRCAGPQWTW